MLSQQASGRLLCCCCWSHFAAGFCTHEKTKTNYVLLHDFPACSSPQVHSWRSKLFWFVGCFWFHIFIWFLQLVKNTEATHHSLYEMTNYILSIIKYLHTVSSKLETRCANVSATSLINGNQKLSKAANPAEMKNVFSPFLYHIRGHILPHLTIYAKRKLQKIHFIVFLY